MSADDRAYRVVVRFEKEKERFFATVPELEVSASGTTRAEAIAQVEEALDSRLQAAASGEAVPAPADVLAAPESITIKLSASAYRDLAYAASMDRMSVEALATELVARGIAYRDRGIARKPGPPMNARAPGGPALDPDAQPSHDPAQQRNEQQNRGGGDRNRGRQREGYRPELDNQANFLEYLRNSERGGNQGNPGGQGQGQGPGGGGRGRGRR